MPHSSLSCFHPGAAVAADLRAQLKQTQLLYENEGVIANRLVAELEEASARLAECEEQIEQYEAKRVSWCAETDELLAENQLLREALDLATIWCRYRSNDDYNTCEDNCAKAYRYQEQCPIYLPTVEQSLTTAEVKRVKGLERVGAAAVTATRMLFAGVPWIDAESIDAALAEGGE